MSRLTAAQRRRRDRIEGVIRLASPVLDLVLWSADRVSRIVERDDPAYDPPRPPAPDSPVRRGALNK